jgi:hypothetical protein
MYLANLLCRPSRALGKGTALGRRGASAPPLHRGARPDDEPWPGLPPATYSSRPWTPRSATKKVDRGSRRGNYGIAIINRNLAAVHSFELRFEWITLR